MCLPFQKRQKFFYNWIESYTLKRNLKRKDQVCFWLIWMVEMRYIYPGFSEGIRGHYRIIASACLGGKNAPDSYAL
jgi:hypothetical protein